MLKVEGKDSQLPVTDSSPKVRLAGHLQLFGPLDTKTNQHPFLWWIPEREARERLRAGEVVQLHFTRKQILSVHMVEKPAAASPDSANATKPAALRRKGMGDSHNHDTDQNPAGVWTINYLPTKSKADKSSPLWLRKLFQAVPLSCLPRAA